MKKVASLLAGLVLMSLSAHALAQGSQPEDILTTMNIYAVYNGPERPTTFMTEQPVLVTHILTYHWNDARGKAPGTIGLRSRNGKMYGPWQAQGSPGQGGVPDANWEVFPEVVIPAGTYTVIDSDPATWAQNSASGGRGMGFVKGIPDFGRAQESYEDVPGERSYQKGHRSSPSVGASGRDGEKAKSKSSPQGSTRKSPQKEVSPKSQTGSKPPSTSNTDVLPAPPPMPD